jgi:L-malate glycosyltransferase
VATRTSRPSRGTWTEPSFERSSWRVRTMIRRVSRRQNDVVGTPRARAEVRSLQPRRIAICTAGSRFEGVERFVLTYSEYLRRQTDLEPFVFLLDEALLAARLRAAGVSVVVLSGRSKYDPAVIRRVREAFVQYGIDLVHTHGYKATLLFGLAARQSGLSVVKTEHGASERRPGWSGLKMRVHYWLDRYVTRRWVDRVVYVSRDLRRGQDEDSKSTFIHNGIDADSMRSAARLLDLGSDPATFHIAIVGRLAPVKGHRVLLEAILLCKHRCRIRLHIFGAGPLEDDLRQRIVRSGLSDQVRIHGFKANIADYIGSVDLVAMPSLHEGLPYTLLEAMLLRRPVVASRVGGLAEVLEHGETGLLFEPGQPAELARLIDQLVDDSALRHTLATRAYRRVTQDFSIRKMASEYLAVYRATFERSPCVEWVTWHASRRTMELARALGVAVRLIRRGRFRWPGRALALTRSFYHLAVTPARILIVQNPSVLLTSAACLLKPLKRYRLIQDLHSAFYGTSQRPKGIRDRVYWSLSRYCARRADLTIVTNAFLGSVVERLGGRAFVLQDKFPDLGRPGRVALAGRQNIAFICTYSPDEPVEEVLQAARRLPSDVVIYITGRPPRKFRSRDIPRNVRLTGYLPEPRYAELLNSADLVLALTTRDHTLLCGAYEAVALGKPLVMSDQKALRDYFRRGVRFTANDSHSLAASIEAALNALDGLQDQVAELKQELSDEWGARFRNLEALLVEQDSARKA